MKQKIILYSTDNAVRSAIRTAFEGDGYYVEEHTDASKFLRPDINEIQQPGTVGRLALPDKVDGVVTTAALSREVRAWRRPWA